MGHSYNNGLVTSNKGTSLEAWNVLFAAAGVPTLVDNGRSGLLASVARTATGRYTFTINAPFGASVVSIIPRLDCVAAAGALQHARYVHGSFSASAGTFEIDVTDNATPTAADPTEATAMHVIAIFQRYTSL